MPLVHRARSRTGTVQTHPGRPTGPPLTVVETGAAEDRRGQTTGSAAFRDIQSAARHADPKRLCAMTGPQEPRPTPNYILAAFKASATYTCRRAERRCHSRDRTDWPADQVHVRCRLSRSGRSQGKVRDRMGISRYSVKSNARESLRPARRRMIHRRGPILPRLLRAVPR
jgi:hypothetical protein